MGIFALRLAAAALIACWSTAVAAQPPGPRIAERCDITFNPVIISQSYDPMSPNDYAVSFAATARRSGGTSTANYSALLLRSTDYRLPTQMFVIADDGAGSGSVLYDRPGPRLASGLDDAGEIDLRFNQSNSTVTRTFQMQMRIPAGTEIDPGLAVGEFDVQYLCDYLDGRSDRGTDNRAFLVYFPVTTAVQASLVGTEPDFGEIGTLSNTDVAGSPPSTTRRQHYLRVASTGPYQVDVVSQNNWRMTATGAPTANPAERIAYRYELLDQELDSTRPNFTPVRCQSSGISGENIALTAILTEGGMGKVPSPNYRDIITITVTPLAFWVTNAVRCD
jgi:hypothetical protein